MNLDRLFNIKNKVVLITGGSGFLGKNYTNFFKELGAEVVNFDIKGNPPVDITNENDVKKNIKKVFKKYKKIDVLINNASLNIHIDKENIEKNRKVDYFAHFENYPLEAFKKGLEVDLIGSFIMSKSVIPYMKKQKNGTIINISSIYALIAPCQDLYKGIKNPFNKNRDIVKPAYYPVAKSGMWGLTLYLASYSAPEIRVNQITLGGIHYHESKTFIKKYSQRTMLKRMGKIEDIYGALLFLATDSSSYVTGANLILDGGYSAW